VERLVGLYVHVAKYALLALIVCAVVVAAGAALLTIGPTFADIGVAAGFFLAALITTLVNGALALLIIGVPLYVLLIERRWLSWRSVLCVGLWPAFVAYSLFDFAVSVVVGVCGACIAAFTHYMMNRVASETGSNNKLQRTRGAASESADG
jgi:hypothetical protein